MKRAISAFLVSMLLLATMPSKGLLLKASAVNYDASAAINYAKNHCSSDQEGGYCPYGWQCASFVSACLRAGGIDVNEPIVVNLKNTIKDFGTIEPLKVTNGKISMYGENAGKIAPGDVVFNYCNNCTQYGKAPYRHVVFCTGEDKDGYIKDCAHNSLHNDKTFGASWSCDGCGSNNWTHYVCHLNGTPTPVYTPTASTDRKLYCIGQNATFSFSAEAASSLHLFISLDGNKLFEGEFDPNESYSRYLSTVGHYAYYIVAHYSSGDVASVWNDFDVVQDFSAYVPAKPTVWFDRDTVASGNTITIHRWSEKARYYSTSIYQNGSLISNNQDSYGVYSTTVSIAGEYKVVTSAINEYGESEYAETYFEVYNTIPDKPDVWTDESMITQGTEFSVHHWSKYALFYSMSVYKDGTLIQNQQNNTSSSTVSLNAVGDYKIVASAINEYGESEYAETYITIASGIPQVPLLWVDNAYVPLGTDAVIHRWSESAKYYSSSIYLNDVLILNNQDSYGVFSVVLTDPGYYKVVTQAINNHGSSGCSEVFFTVYNTIPEEPEIMIQKNYYAPNETITMEINNRALAKESYLSVRNETTGEVVIGPGLHFSQLPNSYSFTVDSDGEYCIEYQTVNEFGSSICASKQFVVVSERLAGDANQDGNVNLKDVVFIRRFLAGGWSVILDKYNSDVNGDLTVDLKDATILTRYLAGGWGVQLA